VTSRAVVIGAGIGGLAASVSLQQAGWEVTVCERAIALEPVGAGLAVAPNGLRALDVLGAGDEIRSLAIAQEPGIRRRDGRWLARSSGRMVAARFGDPVVLLARTTDVTRRSRRVAAMATWTSPPAVAARNAMTLAIGKLMPGAALRSLAPVLDWRPPPGPTPSSS
jgi:2-polyprenyl-6-methoxyphenol hydroxylase-like FAD-dependent oxidoreductase